MDINNLTIKSIHEGLKNKSFSCVEMVNGYLKRIEDLNPNLNVCITVTNERALAQAAKVDDKIAKGEVLGLLEGVPLGVKDIYSTKGIKTTACSRITGDFEPPYESTVTDKLNKEGMIMLAKTNTDEFACGSSTENSAFGATKNPWNPEYVPGGSSGGSAAGVGARMFPVSLGSDTGGSIRQPASFCNVVGLKVTYGRVSRSGVIPMASSWDTMGPFTTNIQDSAFMLKAMAGHDNRDATTPKIEVPDYSTNLGKDIKGMKIGIPKEYFGEGVDAEVKETVMTAIKEYEKMGAELVDISLPYTDYGVSTYYIIMPAELSTNLARFDGIRFGAKASGEVDNYLDYYLKTREEGFGDEIKRRIMIGTYVLSAGYFDAYYKKAQKVRTLIRKDFDQAFEKVDALMAPVSPFPPFKIGSKADDPLAMYLADALVIPASCAGVPAISVPCGFSKDNLPIGLQIIAPQFEEGKLFQLGSAYEQATEWHKALPGMIK